MNGLVHLSIKEIISSKKIYGEEKYMIIKSELFKNYCSTILGAVDSDGISSITETLEIVTVGKVMQLNVTNQDYYVRVNIKMDHEELFHATVDANLFLKLVSQTTSENIELNITNKTLVFKGNGVYNIPLIYNNDTLLNLPEITLNNVTSKFNMHGDILHSINAFNSKQLLKGTISQPVQKYFYMDQEGAITFTTGACVNSFTLPEPIKVLFNTKLVKLFSLLKGREVVFELGHDALTDDIIQTKIRISCDEIEIRAILACDDTMLNSVPAAAIRSRSNFEYPYTVVMDKNILLQAVNRLSLFICDNVKPYVTFNFTDRLTISSDTQSNNEEIRFINAADCDYSCTVDINDFKSTIQNLTEAHITIKFGNQKCLVITSGAISNIIPECSRVI